MNLQQEFIYLYDVNYAQGLALDGIGAILKTPRPSETTSDIDYRYLIKEKLMEIEFCHALLTAAESGRFSYMKEANIHRDALIKTQLALKAAEEYIAAEEAYNRKDSWQEIPGSEVEMRKRWAVQAAYTKWLEVKNG